jgi:hypothetical protein
MGAVGFPAAQHVNERRTYVGLVKSRERYASRSQRDKAFTYYALTVPKLGTKLSNKVNYLSATLFPEPLPIIGAPITTKVQPTYVYLIHAFLPIFRALSPN